MGIDRPAGAPNPENAMSTAAEIQHTTPPFPADVSRAEFEVLVDTYARDLFRYALWLARDRAVAEDVVQETLLRAWRARGSIRDAKAVKSWLMTIVRREHARLYERYRPEFSDVEVERVAGFDGDDKSTEAFVLRRALETLSPEYREPLELQVLGGHSCEEIGRIMGISRGAVMTRVFRAKHKLRELLEADCGNLQTAA